MKFLKIEFVNIVILGELEIKFVIKLLNRLMFVIVVLKEKVAYVLDITTMLLMLKLHIKKS